MIVFFLVSALATLPIHIVRGHETVYTIDNEGSVQRLNYGVIFSETTTALFIQRIMEAQV